ncbi:MAG: hypothetical protein K2M64_02265, partial [Clostridia bacterium]|nr:hypothetical protein [Clostridia bacterium]
MKKLAIVLLAVLCLTCLCCGVAFAAETDAPTNESTSVVKYIKNSFVSGAYLFEENGYLRYGIPLSASEKEYQWEFIGRDGGNYQIKNVATGHYITLSGTFGLKTSVIDTDDKDADSLWKLNLSIPSDESQNITSVGSHNGYALHIIRITDGYVRSEAISSMLSWGEAKWALYDEKEINFDGVIRDGFCIGNGDTYLDASNFTFRQHTRADDNYIWSFVLADGGKKIYNLEQKKYLAVNGSNLELVDEANATVFTVFASKGATIVAGNSALAFSGNALTVVTKANASEFEITLASSVSGILGDLKLDGVYTFSNSWFNMYMLDDTSVPTYGNSAPNNNQIQWEVKYDETTGNSALYNVGGEEYLCIRNNKLTFSKDADYCWKLLRNSNDLYPNAVRFQVASNPNMWLHMESLNGQLQCDTSVQSSWGSPHWEPVKYDPNATATVDNNASVETNKWFRLKSAYGDNLYFYQTNGGYAYGSVAEDDARSHWEFIKDGSSYLMYNRNFDMYLSTYGNGYFTKTEDKAEAIRFGVSKYIEDGSYLIYEKKDGQKDYLASYINIKDRDSLMHLSLVSVDIKETHWILEVAPEKIASNEIVINNTVLPTLKEDNRYKLDNKTVYVEHYANYVRVSDKDGKYLTVADNGKTSWKKFTNDYDTKFYFNYDVLGDDLQLSRSNSVITLQQIDADRTFVLSTGFVVGTDSTLSIYAATAGEYTVKINASQTGDGVKSSVYVDGILQQEFRTGEVSAIDLKLNQGNNLVKFTRMDAIDSIVIKNIVSNGYQGATQGITAYELENCKTNANIEVDARTRWSMTAEASGRSYVLINNVAEYVELTLLHDANALTLRYSVPDTQDGSGDEYTLSLYVNGKSVDNLTLTSEYTHLYGTWDYTNNSDDGYHHVYFDETTYKFDKVQPAGTVIRLRRDFDDQADYYALDLLETELIPDEIRQPANSLSLADYQAEGRSDYQALIMCVNEAVAQGKEEYIP